MAFDEIASHEFDDGSTIAVGTNRHDKPLVAMDGAGGLETTIRFDRVQIKENHILLRRGPGSPVVVAGSVEGSPADYGDVGEWFVEHQDTPLGNLGVA